MVKFVTVSSEWSRDAKGAERATYPDLPFQQNDAVGHNFVSVCDPIKGAQLRVIRQNNFSVKITACVLFSIVNNSCVRVPARLYLFKKPFDPVLLVPPAN